MQSAKTSKKILAQRGRRIHRTRAKVRGTAERPRLAVFRSLKHVQAQVIDDTAGKTLLQVRDADVDKSLKGVARASAVGKMIADQAKAKGISAVVFDRRHYQYHGQVKALADGAREGGLQF